MSRVACIVAIGAVVLTAGAALAQTSPAPAVFDMKGTWKGNNEAIVDGPATHHPPGVEAKPAGAGRPCIQAGFVDPVTPSGTASLFV